MIKHFRFIFIVLLFLMVFTPALHAQSVAVSAHTTFDPSYGMLGECSTEADSLTAAYYESVTSACYVFASNSNTPIAYTTCSASQTARCGTYFFGSPGISYTTINVSSLQMYDSSAFQGNPCPGYWYDPFQYGLPGGTQLPRYTEQGVVPSNRSPYNCWPYDPNDPTGGSVLGLSITSSNPVTPIGISPDNNTLFAGDQVTLTATKPANWTLLDGGPGQLKNTTPTSTVYQAPVPISSDQGLLVKACSQSNNADCALASINLVQVIVSVFPDNIEMVSGETQKFSASMIPSSFDPTNAVTWNASLGAIDQTTASYTPPANNAISSGTATITAKSTKNQNITGTATVYLAKVTAVDVIGPSAMIADPTQSASFTALAAGPAASHNMIWSVLPPTAGSITAIPPNGAIFTPAPGIVKEQQPPAQIQACMAGVCGQTPLTLVPLIRVNPITTAVNSGENNSIRITGTGFGLRPQVTFSDIAIVFTPDALQTDPDTLISGTISAPFLTLPETVVVTVTNASSAVSPPPGQTTVKISPVVITVSLFPGSANVQVGQSATFTPTVTCKTAGGSLCPVPTSQTVSCTLKPNLGSVTSGAACVYTANPPVATQQSLQVVACSTLTPTACGVTCTAPTCGIATVSVPPTGVTVSPKNITLFGGQRKTFSVNVTNNPNTTVTWSVVPDPNASANTNPGAIDQNGNYIAPNPVGVQQAIKVRACSSADSSRCDDAPVTLVPLVVTPSSVVVLVSKTQSFSATTNGANTPVTWSLDPNVAAAGSITTQGLSTGMYTAPSSLSTVTKVTVIATSTVDGSKGTATVALGAVCYPRCRPARHPSGAVIGQSYSGTVLDPTVDTPQGFIYAGNLPPNLNFATDTGAITGIPVQPPAIYGFSATPFYADGSGGTETYAFPVCQSTSASPITVGPYVINNAYSIPYMPGANPPGMFSYSVTGTLPAGMSLDPSTGIVSGTPTTEGTYTYTIHAALQAGVTANTATCPAGTTSDAAYQVTIGCDSTCRIASLTPSSLVFAAQNAGTTSSPQTITLRNSGTGTMSITNVTTTGDFSQTNTCGASLGSGASCIISVSFNPTAGGTRTGTLSVSDNATGSPHTASLSGTGLVPAVNFNVGSLLFAGQALGTTSGSQSVALTNSGTGTLLISSIVATGDFGQTSNCGSSLAAGATCYINVTFTPAAAGLRTGVLSVNDNAPGSPHTINLSGSVVQGYHDIANCQGMAGWAWDSTQPNTPITVYLFDGNRYLGSAYADQYRPDLVGAYGNGYHGFTWVNDVSLMDGAPHSISVHFAPNASSALLGTSPKTITCNPSVSLAWIQPSSRAWGPANTLTAAGFANGGVGNVALSWRDATLNGAWNSVPYQAPPDPNNGGWSNTIPSADNCHAFQATVTYSGKSASLDYDGVALGYCSFRVIWIQPQALAGFGPPGSLVVAGSAQGGPPNAQVTLWVRDDTAGSGWAPLSFAPIPDATGIWYNAVENVDYTHQYSVYIVYDDRSSGSCSYFGNNSATNCP